MRRAALVIAVSLTLGSAAHGAADLTKPGRFNVGVATVTVSDQAREGRTLPVELWYPARTTGRGAEALLANGYPLVLVAHGFCGSRLNYEYVATHLASWGFLVAAPDFTGVTKADCDAHQVTAGPEQMRDDLAFVCRVLHDVRGPLGVWALRVRGVPTGIVGHSLGGLAGVLATTVEKSFTTVVALAPAVTAAHAALVADLPQRVAWMTMGATGDVLVSLDAWTTPFFQALAPPAFLVRITGGSHGGFSDTDDGLAPEALAAQQAAVRRYATPFLLKYLAKKNKYAKRLRAADDGTVALVARPK